MTDRQQESTPSWREVAEALAQRLSWSACDSHSVSDANLADCPFCQDVAAYALFVAKLGHDPHPAPTGPTVLVSDLRQMSS